MLQKKHIITTILLSAMMEVSFAEEVVTTPTTEPTTQTSQLQVDQQANLDKLQQATQGIKLVFPEKLAEIYAARNFSPIWQDAEAKNYFYVIMRYLD